MAGPEKQTFAGYEILAQLGRGGMGAVYKARQPKLDRLIALKIMATELAADPDFVARFKREASAAAALNHEGIVQVFAAGESDGTHFIAMEFVEGETLRAHIESQGKLDPREAVAITILVAQALAYAWNKARIIHRDIKPENIFLSNTGEVKVGDLGLAKTVGGGSTSLTQTGTMMGSPHYISPEQARGLSDIDFRTDIYSLGCTLYHMLTGRPPYTGTDPLVVINKHVNEPPPAIFKVWPTCPIPLALLVGKMLAKQRHERPASYEDLIEQLHEVRDKLKPATTVAPVSAGEPTQVLPTPAPAPAQPTPKPVMAKTPTLAPKARESKPATRNSGLVMGGAVAAAALLLGGLFLWSPWKTEPGSESRLQAESALTPPAKAGTPNATFPTSKNWHDWMAEQRRSRKIPDGFEDDGRVWIKIPRAGTARGLPRLAKSMRDGAVQITFKLSEETTAAVGIDLRRAGTTEHDGYQGYLNRTAVTLLRFERGKPRSILIRPLPASVDPNQEMTFEFRAVGDELICKANGQTVVVCRDSMFSATGEALFYCKGSGTRISRIEVLNLDGASTGENWQDWMAEQRRSRNIPNAYEDDGRAWVKVKPGLINLGNSMLNGAARVTFALPDQETAAAAVDLRSAKDGRAYRGMVMRKSVFLQLMEPQAGGQPESSQRNTKVLRTWPMPKDVDVTQEITIEFHAVGDELSIKVNDRLIGAVHDSTCNQAGEVAVYGRNSGTRISRIEVLNLDSVSTSSLRNPQSAIAPNAGWQNAINLLPLIDPQKDAVEGTWSVKNGELIVTSASMDRIQIPYHPPAEYDFRISFTPQSCRDAIWQFLAGGGCQFDLCIGGVRNKCFGFEIIGEKQVQENPSGVLLTEGVADGQRYTSLVQVRKDGVKGFLDGRFIAEWKTNYRDMRLPRMCRLGDDKALGVGANNSPTIFHRIEVREVTGKGTFTRGAPVSSAGPVTSHESRITPADTAFCAEVAALPAEQQVARVAAKLKELNPDFDGKVEPVIRNNKVAELRFCSVGVLNIAPVKALQDLRALNCAGKYLMKGSRGSLEDLSPLQGLKLEDIQCQDNPIRDLSPLKGMPLTCLFIASTSVTDLTPLNGMPLVKLNCNGTPIRDLSPLIGAPLQTFHCAGSRVEDLSPLKGMGLKTLTIHSIWKVPNLDVLRGMPLESLSCDFVPSRDTEVLRSIRTLKTINKLPAAEFWKKVDAGEVPKP